jgi:hypothetical protein
MDDFLQALFPQAPSYLTGLLGEEQALAAQKQAQQQGLLGLGLGLLQAAAPAPVRPSFGAGLAQGIASGQQAYQNVFQQRVQEQQLMQQLAEQQRQRQAQQAMQTLLPVAVRGGQLSDEALSLAAGVMKPEDFAKLTTSIKTLQEVREGPKPEYREVGGALYEIARGQPPKLVVNAQGNMTGDFANVALGLFGTSNVNELPPGAFQQIQSEIIRQKEAGRTVIDMTGGQKGFENERALRNDFQGSPEYKGFQEMKAAYSQVIDSLKQNTPIGDVAAATKIMKLLDPGSVVRESELAIAMQATGLLDRVIGYSNNILKGQKLTPAQKVEFSKLSEDLFTTAVNSFNEKRDQYSNLALEYGFAPERVVGKPIELIKPQGSPQVNLQEAAAAELRRRRGQ